MCLKVSRRANEFDLIDLDSNRQQASVKMLRAFFRYLGGTLIQLGEENDEYVRPPAYEEICPTPVRVRMIRRGALDYNIEIQYQGHRVYGDSSSMYRFVFNKTPWERGMRGEWQPDFGMKKGIFTTRIQQTSHNPYLQVTYEVSGSKAALVKFLEHNEVIKPALCEYMMTKGYKYRYACADWRCWMIFEKWWMAEEHHQWRGHAILDWGSPVQFESPDSGYRVWREFGTTSVCK